LAVAGENGEWFVTATVVYNGSVFIGDGVMKAYYLVFFE
jgi:hypothetical protein